MTLLKAFIIFFCAFKIATAIDGVIWSKDNQDFVPIGSIYNFSSYPSQRLCILNESRKLEIHKFQNQTINIGFTYVRQNQTLNYRSFSDLSIL